MEWIKVTDRLPEDEQIIIAYGRNNKSNKLEVNSCRFYIETAGNPPYPVFMVYDWPTYFLIEDVTHWMPLPAHPKPE